MFGGANLKGGDGGGADGAGAEEEEEEEEGELECCTGVHYADGMGATVSQCSAVATASERAC